MADHHHHDDSTPADDTPASSPWSFHSASPEREPQQPRPRAASQSSLPRALFGSGSGSIFGSGSGSSSSSSAVRQRPSLNIRPPSSEDTLEPAPESAPLHLPAARLERRYEDEIRATVDRRRVPRVEKDADDTSVAPAPSAADQRQRSSTLTTLSRLFAVQANVSPDASRATSFNEDAVRYTRQMHGQTTALPEHLYARGFLEGRHSDITVHAFGKEYKLHRLILDRAPFFATALSEPWLEASAKEMTVRPDEIDASITQHAFELALRRLYGCPDIQEEDAYAVGLFATGCWLEMVDVIDSSIESMLRQMSPAMLAPLINLVTKNYYGKAGDKILASAKAMLCRDGWKMPVRYWDGVPADIVREIVGGDGFFVDGEWERWLLAKRILDRRLKARAVEAGLTEPGSKRRPAKAPSALAAMAVRFDAVSRRSAPAAFGYGLPDSMAKYVSLYTHPTIEPLLVLLDEGVHYIHLGFEQLQYIRTSKDVLGLPVMPEKVVSNALWQQMELRQRVMNARENDLELGMAVQATEEVTASDTTMSINNPASPPGGKGKHKATDSSSTVDFGQDEDDYDSQSWDGTGRPRKFWIPSSDCNIVMGGNAEPFIATSNSNTMQRHAARLSATVQPEDVTWASDFATSTTTAQPRPGTSDGSAAEAPPPSVSYTHLPPFRFSAEFPAPRSLKERRRVYSRTVFYAGSLWNIYIQKVASARSTKQLGVYLHRAKERETEEAVFGASGAGSNAVNHVEGRINLLEREMLTSRSEARRRHHQRRSEEIRLEGGEESSGSAGDAEASSHRMRLPLRHRKSGQRDVLASSPQDAEFSHLASDSHTPSSTDSDSADDFAPTRPPATARSASSSGIPTLPPYVDARPTIKTYFKIYSPSRGGRMLSVYESAPDKFNFSQSWGWKSSTLMLDEGMMSGEGEEVQQVGVVDMGVSDGGKVREDGRLRFMVVIGNI